MQKIKSKLFVTASIGILFATGSMFSHAFTKVNLGTPIALGEEGGNDAQESNDSADTHEDAKQEEDMKKEEGDVNEDNQEAQQVRTTEHKTIRVRTSEELKENKQKEDQEAEDDIDESDENNHEAQEDVTSLDDKIAKIEAKLSLLVTSDPKSFNAFNASLGEIKALMAQAATTKDAAQPESLTEVIKHKIESLTKLMEVAFEHDDEQSEETTDDADQDIAKQYGSSVAQFVHALKAVEEAGDGKDKGIGEQVRVVAQAQNESQIKVESSINDINERSGFTKFLVGPKYGSLAAVQAAIVENQTRIKVLADLTSQITDPAVKLVLQGQIASLQAQTATLQTFVAKSEGGVSLFGWLAKMLA